MSERAEAVGTPVREGLTATVGTWLGECIARLAAGAQASVAAVRIRLTPAAGPAPLVAQVNAEISGRRIRVQVAAPHLNALLDRLAGRLAKCFAQASRGWSPRPWPDPEGAAVRAVPQVLPGVEPRIVRVKAPQLVWCSPAVAAMTMDAMDYDVHLFTDPDTERDAVVYRVGPTGYRVARTVAAGPPQRSGVPLTLSAHGVPRLDEAQAVERLRRTESPFLFFARPGSDRGRVLYRRFDGHYGLIEGAR
ncbi:sigma 54 modulation/S30EA ribosomal C-terminal domain-containing protein [Streptomyces sp. HB2AG]|uniref:sigma 54 modulation/S30EA ribosomal C-terminal domain-containing protein n=1 Tax=Streptomyces sp. HB2AG TaxID=2983400 RepID=UPI0022AA9336|nr:sigma 54 modulation/S30EA ribosomal C-terminal domain-containing protein [Streptomyces sp. HB2AG]MCZ2527758.1 sigma 54 modulation/S30EA ribosomal C-terminal domain-containing protein [Streptomyces sp. HB2AG]